MLEAVPSLIFSFPHTLLTTLLQAANDSANETANDSSKLPTQRHYATLEEDTESK